MKLFVKAKFAPVDAVSEPRVVKKHCTDQNEAFAYAALMLAEGAISITIRPEQAR